MKTLAGSFSLLLFAMVLGAPLAAQRKALEHEDYAVWNRIRGQQLSTDGRWLLYSLVPGDGDGELTVRTVESDRRFTRARGTDAHFTNDSRYVVFTIAPEEEAVKEADRESVPKNEQPKDSIGIMDLRSVFPAGGGVTSEHFTAERVQSFKLPEDAAGFVAYLLEKPVPDEADEGDEEAASPERPPRGRRSGDDEDEEDDDDKAEGTVLVLRVLATGEEHRYEHVTDYLFSADGERLYYSASNEDGTADGVYAVETATGEATPVVTGEGEYEQLALNEEGRSVAFLSNAPDWDADQPAFTLFVDGEARATEGGAGIPDGWWINERGDVSFSEDGSRVFFGTSPRPEPEKDEEDDDDDEEVVLDIWNWKDPYMMPMQLLQAESERNRSFMAVTHVDGGPSVQLATQEIPNVSVGRDGDADVALGTTDIPYRQLLSWDGRYNDLYIIDVETGARERAVEALRGRGQLSPGAKYLYWWNGFEMAWFAMNVEDGELVEISAGIPHPVHNILNDVPQAPRPADQAVWTEDDERVLIYDRYDIWLVDPTGREAPRNVTEGVGRSEGIRFRYVREDSDEEAVDLDREALLSAFNLTTKQDGYYRDRLGRNDRPQRLVMGDFDLSSPTKAEDADVVIFTRQTFTEFPDLWTSSSDFSDMTRLSDANPQQSEYRWGTAELVEWNSNDGVPLQGILYKPDGFDPTQKYPMMVYFYERMSDRLHRYTVPAAGSSSINYSFYVSRGYVLFIPDIPYEIGHPGESAIDAVIPGVLSVVTKGFIDTDKIGVQGHSWGGYQIAHMITRTNLFAAAEAGAPVVNMTSAYGGIRWGSGRVRQFQYERAQSRIGGSLWERPLEFIENSPLFQADKIQTPLLMLHNDKDGAVPWYQGIEMFSAMRRLGKPTWMLNYNGEAHGLRKEQNRKDWAIRMQQFFDHYLMDAPPAVWMVRGVPAVLKGRTLGLELVTKPISEQPDGGGR